MDPTAESPSFAGISRQLQGIVPSDRDQLQLYVLDENAHGRPYMHQLHTAVDLFYSGDWLSCCKNCQILLDITWEKLNTGHWSEVPMTWRYAYTLVSLLKATCQYAVCSSDPQRLQAAIKTCDMGLLMGAPLLDNILARLVTRLQGIWTENQRRLAQSTGDEVKDVTIAVADDTSPKRDVSSAVEIETTKSSIHRAGDVVLEPAQVDQTDDDMAHPVSRMELEKLNPKKRHKADHFVSPNISSNHSIAAVSLPSLEYFSKNFLKKGIPVIIRDAISYWPAFNEHKWTIDYIKQVAGCRTVPIELGSKYTEDSWSQKLMTVSEFIEKCIVGRSSGPVGYLAQHQLFDQIPELKRDISIPTYCCLGDCEDVDVNAWFGPCGTVSPLHHDPKHNLLAQVVGEKYIRLYAPEHSHMVYPHTDCLLSNTAQVEVEDPDLEKFPLFSEAPYQECVLKQGDMLYIPPQHWHYVRSLAVSFSVSFWWE